MRFVYYLEDSGHPFLLRELRAGALGVGGQTVRLRLLFWLAARGNEVFVANHHDAATVDGVQALRVGSIDDLPALVRRLRDIDLFVFNNQDAARSLVDLHLPGVRAKAMWAGNPFPSAWLRWLDEERLHRIVCVSQNHREFYRPYPGFRRLEMSYSGIDLDLLDETDGPGCEKDRVVFIGAPRITKGFHNLLSAWPHIRAARPGARLVVLGAATLHDASARVGWTGVLDAGLEAAFLDPIVGGSRDLEGAGIAFRGLLRPISEVFRELRRAAVAVVNCNWTGSVETYCRSAIEAQAAGVPVVGAARGSLPEVVRDGETGILVDEPDPRALAAAVCRLLADDALRGRYGATGRVWARSIGDYSHLCTDWEDIARRAAVDAPAPAPRRLGGDLLRRIGYGRARMAVGRLVRGARA